MNVALCVMTVAQCVYAASVSVGRAAAEGRRTCALYCRVGIGFHLQIHEDGRVNGSHEPSRLSVLELFAVSRGVIGIRGVHSNLFLAMNHRGRLHATEYFSDDCLFRERFQDNGYNTYSSVAHVGRRSGRSWYVALNKLGRARMGSSPRVKSQHVSTHFLPRASPGARAGPAFTLAGPAFTLAGPAFTLAGPAFTLAGPAFTVADPPPRGGAGRPGLRRREPKRPTKYWPKYRMG